MNRTKGKVKWFNNTKGFGFVNAEGREEDIFIHYSAILGEGYKTLNENDTVTFELVDHVKGPQAYNLYKED